MEHPTFIDSISYLPMPLRKPHEAFGLSVRKSLYPHYFNTKPNLIYVGPMPEPGLYEVEDQTVSERREFMASYDAQKDKVFENRRLQDKNCHDYVTVLLTAC